MIGAMLPGLSGMIVSAVRRLAGAGFSKTRWFDLARLRGIILLRGDHHGRSAATFEDRDAVDEILFALHDISQVLFVFFPLKAA